jgi:glycosyltransferase involved in cell wall biosynthesis
VIPAQLRRDSDARAGMDTRRQAAAMVIPMPAGYGRSRLKQRLGMNISVVIPAYNAARFLPRCLKSAFAQTLKPVEIIVVDDGSTDDTAAVAAGLGAIVLRRPNGGPGAARNAGIHFASGEWIALLDADDLWAVEKLERQAACIRPETVLVYTGIRIFDGIREEQHAIEAASARKMLRYCNPIATSSVLMRRRAALADGGFCEEIHSCEDWELWVRLERAGDFEAVADPLTDYYVYPQSFSVNPAKMLEGLDQIIETTLLAGLRGFNRWAWRRRIRAVQLCSAGLIARDNGLKNEARYMLQSLCVWPSPWWKPRRFALFAISARNRVFRRHKA